MLQKILVPLDGSELADRALTHVRRLLRTSDAEVVLLRIVEEEAATGTHPPGHNPLGLARRHLEGLRAELAGQGARARTRVEVGDPATKVVEYAQEISASLIVLSTHGRSGLTRLLRGSTAERILRRSPVPVFLANPAALAPGNEGRLARILVPVDGSERSAEVLPLACELARAHGSELVLVNVLEVVVTPDPVIAVSPIRTKDEANALLESYRKRIDPAIPVRTRTALGAPAIAILDAVQEEKADLVAMATHGRSGLSRWVYGSVAEQIVRHAPCPLLVVRTAGFQEGAVAARETAQSEAV